jgi:aspartate ammonia-lyase
MQQYRLEHDFLGNMQVPVNRYYGIQTQRGLDNFPISGVPIYHFPEFIKAFAFIKKACAEANRDLCLIDPELSTAIVAACDEIANGRFHREFVVDMIQGGGGTSTNMNFNEVIANRALELLGYEKGRYDILHPNTPTT